MGRAERVVHVGVAELSQFLGELRVVLLLALVEAEVLKQAARRHRAAPQPWPCAASPTVSVANATGLPSSSCKGAAAAGASENFSSKPSPDGTAEVAHENDARRRRRRAFRWWAAPP